MILKYRLLILVLLMLVKQNKIIHNLLLDPYKEVTFYFI